MAASTKQQKALEEDEIDEIDDEDMDMGDDDMENEFFWRMTVKPNDDECILPEPAVPNSIIHITHASFGEQVAKGSRTLLCCSSNMDEEGIPICVLTEGNHESKQLDLIFASPVKFSLKGRSPSTVYLTGYVQPEPSPMDPDEFDGMSESEMDVHENVLRQKLQARKRSAIEDEENVQEPATKKKKNGNNNSTRKTTTNKTNKTKNCQSDN